ncbi:uncharacterized protein LOC107849150 [Capsicum annuum]|uniref:uncharacterized protein LOC107849150 n=1 Tax=Capsicum annuum TaxID=4072 RepID=UPI0007BF34ED|nr:uncharacterized protein LOC107849150 [Capsicum annuum]
MSGYLKFMNDLVSIKRIVSYEPVDNIHHYSVVASRLLIEKKEDPGDFTIPCTIEYFNISRDLCILGESINLMTLVVFKKLGLGAPKLMLMRLLMADWIMKKPVGILFDFLLNVVLFNILADFLILDCEVDLQVPIIFGRPFLPTIRALVDMELGKIRFINNDEQVNFNICQSMQKPYIMTFVSIIESIDNKINAVSVLIERRLGVEALAVVIMNFNVDGIEEYD